MPQTDEAPTPVTIEPVSRWLTSSLSFVGCQGGSEPKRTLEGRTYRKEPGLSLIVDRVELRSEETLAYVTIRNPSARKFTFDPYSTRLTVDDQQYESDPSPGYPAVSTEVGSTGESSGVLVFPAVSAHATRYELHGQGFGSVGLLPERWGNGPGTIRTSRLATATPCLSRCRHTPRCAPSPPLTPGRQPAPWPVPRQSSSPVGALGRSTSRAATM